MDHDQFFLRASHSDDLDCLAVGVVTETDEPGVEHIGV
jgi:hypothetical protein